MHRTRCGYRGQMLGVSIGVLGKFWDESHHWEMTEGSFKGLQGGCFEGGQVVDMIAPIGKLENRRTLLRAKRGCEVSACWHSEGSNY